MAENIVRQDLAIGMGQSYINYAMSVLTDRALPDVRDGLKPVQRCILYAMHELDLGPTNAYKKSARPVADAMGKYHPHGDASIYESLVNMAQDFSLRYPLVQGHGNFGSVDGDPAAAMRYTESRLTRIGYQMLQDIEKNSVDFEPNFDNSLQKPTVLPTLFPSLLANGTVGIAVGMATNIPPHNIGEVYDAISFIIDKVSVGEDFSVDELMEYVKAPDFPTGCTIMGLDGVREAYRTGKGRIVVRSTYEVEEKGGKTSIVISEIPYHVNKAKLVEKIDELSRKGTVIGIREIRDESDRDGMRIVIELKKDTNTQLVINKLLKHTALQSSFSVNMNVLVDKQPRQINLKEALEAFLTHAANVIIRRTQYDLDKAQKRLHIVEGLLKAIENIDAAIEILRHAPDSATAVQQLVAKLELTQEQAEAIADMRLRSLTGANVTKLHEEQDQLNGNISRFRSILEDQTVLLSVMKSEFTALKEKFSDERRTKIGGQEKTIEEVDLVNEETLVVTISSDGLIKSVEEKEYRTQARGGKGSRAASTNEDEIVTVLMTVNSKDDILFFTNQGKCHTLKAFKIQKANKQSRGKSLNNYISLESDERVVSILSANLDSKEDHLLFVTRHGVLKRLALEELSTRFSSTKVITFREEDSLVSALIVKSSDQVLITTALGQSIRIPMDSEGAKNIRPMGRLAAGVTGISLDKGDYVVDMVIANDEFALLTVTENGLGKRTEMENYTPQARGGKGSSGHKITKKTGRLVAAIPVKDNDELFIATAKGMVVRLKAHTIRMSGKVTSGVRIMALASDDKIASISKVVVEEE